MRPLKTKTGMIILFILSAVSLCACQKKPKEDPDFKLDFINEENDGSQKEEDTREAIEREEVMSTEAILNEILEQMSIPDVAKEVTDEYKESNYFYDKSSFDDSIDKALIEPMDVSSYLQVGDYIGMLLPRKGSPASLTQIKIDEKIDALFNDYEMSSYPCKDAATDGNIVVLTSKTALNDETVKEETAYYMLGNDELPASLEKEVLGKSPGDSFHMKSSFPEDYADKSLAGKTMEIEGILNEVRRPYPYTNESLSVITNGRFETLNDYSEYLAEMIQKQNEEEKIILYVNDVINILDRMTTISSVPDEMTDFYLELFKSSRLKEGKEDVLNSTAKELAKAELICRYVLQKENSPVTEEEIQGEFELIRFGADIHTQKEWADYLEKTQSKEAIVKNLIINKAVKIIMDNADYI